MAELPGVYSGNMVNTFSGSNRFGPGSDPFISGYECVPIPLLSVRCNRYFGVEIRGPGSEGGESNPVSMTLAGPFTDLDPALQEAVMEASDSEDLLDEVCRMVIDELGRLSSAGQ